jgi:hypothetical protein
MTDSRPGPIAAARVTCFPASCRALGSRSARMPGGAPRMFAGP